MFFIAQPEAYKIQRASIMASYVWRQRSTTVLPERRKIFTGVTGSAQLNLTKKKKRSPVGMGKMGTSIIVKMRSSAGSCDGLQLHTS